MAYLVELPIAAADGRPDVVRAEIEAPDETGIEFGLSLSAEADVVISSTAAAAPAPRS